MKKLSNLGEILTKEDQKVINGGMYTDSRWRRCSNSRCPAGYCCGSDPYHCVSAGEYSRNCR